MADLRHSWGNSPRMKQLEKEYNAKYYQEHKDKWLERYHLDELNQMERDALFKKGGIRSVVPDGIARMKNGVPYKDRVELNKRLYRMGEGAKAEVKDALLSRYGVGGAIQDTKHYHSKLDPDASRRRQRVLYDIKSGLFDSPTEYGAEYSGLYNNLSSYTDDIKKGASFIAKLLTKKR